MKKRILSPILLLCMTANFASGLADEPKIRTCCDHGIYLNPKTKRCGLDNATDSKVDITCISGSFLIRDAIIDGTKLSTADAPTFIFAENPNSYCKGQFLEKSNGNPDKTVDVALVCFDTYDQRDDQSRYKVTGVLTIISSIFLFITIGVYLSIERLRDLQGKCIVCMCFCSALGFLSLGTIQLEPGFLSTICKVHGFLMYFWMMANFFWMNVVSINVYRNTVKPEYLKKTQLKQFLMYSAYAWGTPAVIFIIALCLEFIQGSHLKPNIGTIGCWFGGNAATWLFFYGPVSILILSNIVLFIVTFAELRRCTKNYEVSVLNAIKYKCLLGLKLFLIMGISWVFEIASFAHGGDLLLWDVMDVFNCLQGVVVFLVLVVFRRKVLQSFSTWSPLARKLLDKLSKNEEYDDKEQLEDADGNTNVPLD